MPNPALWAFVAKNKSKDVRILLATRDVNIDEEGGDPLSTPLYVALMNQNTDMVRLLLQNNANPNKQNHRGCTPLSLLTQLRVDIVKMLLDYSADVNLKNAEGHSPLSIATRGRFTNDNIQISITHMLIDYGADINSRSNNGITPLMSAVCNGSYWIVTILLNYDADISIRNDNGKTAEELGINGNPGQRLCATILRCIRNQQEKHLAIAMKQKLSTDVARRVFQYIPTAHSTMSSSLP